MKTNPSMCVCMCVFVGVCVCVCVFVGVCVCERERERKRVYHKVCIVLLYSKLSKSDQFSPFKKATDRSVQGW